MLIASRRSHIPSSNYSRPPSSQTTTAQEATTAAAAAAKKERTREPPQDTYLTTRKKDTNQKNKRTNKHTPKEQQHRQTETERQQQAYPPLLQTLKAVVLGVNYPSIVRGIIVVFGVALIQNSLAVVIAVSGGSDSVRERILPHFVGSCSKAKNQALLATTTTSIARNA